LKSIKNIKLFVSCPRDIKSELDSIDVIVNEINKTSGEQGGYKIEILNWKTDTYSGIGDDAQEVINEQIDKKYDILIGLLWQNIGTPTKRDKSGTVEEINRAIQNKKEFLIYFNIIPPENLNLVDLKALKKVNKFKEELQEKGVLFKQYNSIEGFEGFLRIQLPTIIADRLLIKKKVISKKVIDKNPKKSKLKVDKYSSISNAIEKVENHKEQTSFDEDIFDLLSSTLLAMDIVTKCMGSITNSMNDFSAKLTKRTKEMNGLPKIKDHRLRFKKSKTIVSSLVGEMDEFSSLINGELSNFSTNFRVIGPNYTRILLYANSLEDQSEVLTMKESIQDFRNSVERATKSGADVLEIALKWPPVNPEFTKSKRELAVTLKNLVKEMLEGLKLLDEAIKE